MSSGKNVHVYCDSSSHRGHEFMVVGAISIPVRHIARFEQEMQAIKDKAGMTGKFRFSDYRGGRKQQAYEALVDLFYREISHNLIHFHAICCSFKEFDHHLNGKGSPEKSVNKLYYQLFLHRICRKYGKESDIHAFPDRGDDSKELIGFREALCAAAYKKYNTRPNCLKAINPQNSDETPLIQMTDVIIGSIANMRNGHNPDGHKGRLAKFVLNQAPLKCWSHGTPRDETKFTVWNFQGR